MSDRKKAAREHGYGLTDSPLLAFVNGWDAACEAKDAEVERLKRAVKVMADSLSRSWPGYTYAIDIMAFNREALAKAEAILKDGE